MVWFDRSSRNRSCHRVHKRPASLLRIINVFTCWMIVGISASFARAAEPAKARGNETVTVDEQTEAVIKSALKYLASKQSPNGSWSEQNHPTALTGYSLMPLL